MILRDRAMEEIRGSAQAKARGSGFFPNLAPSRPYDDRRVWHSGKSAPRSGGGSRADKATASRSPGSPVTSSPLSRSCRPGSVKTMAPHGAWTCRRRRHGLRRGTGRMLRSDYERRPAHGTPRKDVDVAVGRYARAPEWWNPPQILTFRNHRPCGRASLERFQPWRSGFHKSAGVRKA